MSTHPLDVMYQYRDQIQQRIDLQVSNEAHTLQEATSLRQQIDADTALLLALAETITTLEQATPIPTPDEQARIAAFGFDIPEDNPA